MKRELKDAIYSSLAGVTKALGSPKRLEIIEILSQGEKTVEVIAEHTALGIKNASAQLKELRSARLVDSRKDGKFVYYRLADASVVHFWLSLRDFAEQRSVELQAIMRDALSSPDTLEEMSRKELLARAKRGEVVLIDVRPRDEFETAHLPFAISVPIDEIPKYLKTLSKNKEVVAYCRGPYCFFAKEAVEELKKRGFKASRLKDSVHDWKTHGLPLEGKSLA